jgi:hypothetical protein
MNNNSIEFTKKYLKYKYKYITLKDQSFSTYDTKIKQTGGAYDFVCVIDEDGPFASVKECYKKSTSTISYDIEPPLRLWQDSDEGRPLKATSFGCELTYTKREYDKAELTLEGQNKNKRRFILLDTFVRFEKHNDGLYYHRHARDNLIRWAADKPQMPTDKKCIVTVIEDDWGVVAQKYTMLYGKCFAVLNMANGFNPGGGYTRGAAAQEENMFRRTDCHFSLRRYDTIIQDETSKSKCKWVYTQTQSNLINGVNKYVYLDMKKARVCIRGPEDYLRADLGYPLLKDNEVFPFYELRAAAVNLTGREEMYDHVETCKRIAAQFNTLRVYGVRHVVLSAFGCGAFSNPPEDVAKAYYDELMKLHTYFDVVVFAIFYAGTGLNNYSVFDKQFSTWNVS